MQAVGNNTAHQEFGKSERFIMKTILEAFPQDWVLERQILQRVWSFRETKLM